MFRPLPAALALAALLLSACTGQPTPTADTTGPTLSLAVSTATLTSAGDVRFDATATDSSGVRNVTFKLGGQTLAVDPDSPYQASRAFTSADNGTYTVQAIATDTHGNTSTAEQTFVVSISPAPASTYTVSGTVAGWAGGTGTLSAQASPLVAWTKDSVDSFSSLLQPLGTAGVGQDGRFNLALPLSPAVTLYPITETLKAFGGSDPAACLNALSISDRDAQGISLVVSDPAGNILQPLGPASKGIIVYADRAVTLRGSCDEGAVTVDWRFEAGWNTTTFTVGAGAGVVLASTPLPSSTWTTAGLF